MSTKELRELVKAISAVILEAHDAVRHDGNFSKWDGVKALHLIPTIIIGIKGYSNIPAEARDIQPEEWAEITADVKETFLKTGQTYRNADIVELAMNLAYHNIVQISKMCQLPLTAEAA